MILCFSGTGNSRFVAKQIAEKLGDESVSLNQLIKNGDSESLHSAVPYVFVAPTYAWRLPVIVRQFILDHDFTGNSNAYFVMTCSGSVGNATVLIKRLCAKKGFAFRGLAEVIMPENYITHVPGPAKIEAIIKTAQPSIDRATRLIAEGKNYDLINSSLIGRLESSLGNILFRTFVVSDRAFRTTDVCTGCGLCAKNCPVDDICLSKGKPSWRGRCIQCMSCIGCCPTGAIEYGRKSVGQARYYLS